MATLFLIRHGRTQANSEGVLTGRTPGVGLDEVGAAQAKALADRLTGIPLAALVTSPLQRCQETATAISDTQPAVEDRLSEVDYGQWQGESLKKLAKEKLWRVVQQHPSAVTFPGGEAMSAMSGRAVAAVREWDAHVEESSGPDAIWAAISHGDVIKAIVADALGIHLDQFQRIVVDPCSVTVVRYTPLRPFVVHLNDTGGDLRHLAPKRKRRSRRSSTSRAESEAQVGGGVGSEA